MKEKLDKYVKDTLLDLCDLFDIPVSKTTMRKVGGLFFQSLCIMIQVKAEFCL